jgi:hypothetical protein
MSAVFDQEKSVFFGDGLHLADRPRKANEVRQVKRRGFWADLPFDVVQVDLHSASHAIKLESCPCIHQGLDLDSMMIGRHQDLAAFEAEELYQVPQSISRKVEVSNLGGRKWKGLFSSRQPE